jgi:hypothetical protein
MAQAYAQAVTLLETLPRYAVTVKLRGSIERVEVFAANNAREAADRVASWYQIQSGRTYEARQILYP